MVICGNVIIFVWSIVGLEFKSCRFDWGITFTTWQLRHNIWISALTLNLCLRQTCYCYSLNPLCYLSFLPKHEIHDTQDTDIVMLQQDMVKTEKVERKSKLSQRMKEVTQWKRGMSTVKHIKGFSIVVHAMLCLQYKQRVIPFKG